MSHNSFNSDEDGFINPNQNINVAAQLEMGVRGFMLDIYMSGGVPTVYHGTSILGSEPLSTYLTNIKEFLDTNSNEIVSIIFQTEITSQELESDLINTGLDSYLYEYDSVLGWPTLQEMIDNNDRLVVFSESDNGVGQPWYLYAWEMMTETHYSYSGPSDFSCDYNRGNPDNELFLFNHWITTFFGFADANEAQVVNEENFLMNRVIECYNDNGHFPNFIGLDFVSIGDGMTVVDQINGGILEAKEIQFNEDWIVYPNPSQNLISLPAHSSNSSINLKVLNLAGMEITELVSINSGHEELLIDIAALKRGVYLVQLNGVSTKFVKE